MKEFLFVFVLFFMVSNSVLASCEEVLHDKNGKEQFLLYQKYLLPVELGIAKASNLLETYSETPIVILYGPSCAGKTTITRTLSKVFLCSSIDEILGDFYISKLKQQYSQSINTLLLTCQNDANNLLFYIFEQICPFAQSNPVWDAELTSIRQSLLQMIEDQLYFDPIFSLFEKTFDNSLQGKVSILDLVGDSALYFFQAMGLRLFHCPVIKCFVFCSPEALSVRIRSRNNKALGSGNLGNIRFNSLPVMQLIKDCARTQFMSRSFLSEKLQYSILGILDTVIQNEKEILSLINSPRQSDEIYLQKRKEAIIAELFNPHSNHHIVCDIVIDTSVDKFSKARLINLLKLVRYGEIYDQ